MSTTTGGECLVEVNKTPPRTDDSQNTDKTSHLVSVTETFGNSRDDFYRRIGVSENVSQSLLQRKTDDSRTSRVDPIYSLVHSRVSSSLILPHIVSDPHTPHPSTTNFLDLKVNPPYSSFLDITCSTADVNYCYRNF